MWEIGPLGETPGPRRASGPHGIEEMVMSETNTPPEPPADGDLDEDKIDEAMDGTFPASDPPSHTGTTGPGDGKKD